MPSPPWNARLARANPVVPAGAFVGAILATLRIAACAAATLGFGVIVKDRVGFAVEARSEERPYWQMSGVERIVFGCSLIRLEAIDLERRAQAFGAASGAAVEVETVAPAATSVAAASAIHWKRLAPVLLIRSLLSRWR